jgi:hypothetical protein
MSRANSTVHKALITNRLKKICRRLGEGVVAYGCVSRNRDNAKAYVRISPASKVSGSLGNDS